MTARKTRRERVAYNAFRRVVSVNSLGEDRMTRWSDLLRLAVRVNCYCYEEGCRRCDGNGWTFTRDPREVDDYGLLEETL